MRHLHTPHPRASQGTQKRPCGLLWRSIWLALVLLVVDFAITHAHAARTDSEGSALRIHYDPELETVLDAMLGTGMYPVDRERFAQFLADTDVYMPIGTFVRAWTYRVLELVHAERDYSEALALSQELISKAKAVGFADAIAEAYGGKIEALQAAGKRDRAVAAIVLLQPYLEATSEQRVQFFVHNTAGRVLQESQQFEEALEHYLSAQQAISLGAGLQTVRRRQFLNLHIARLQAELEHYEPAFELVESTIAEAMREGVHHRLPELYLLKGYVQGSLNPDDPRQSIATYEKSLYWAIENNDVHRQVVARNNIGSVLISLGDYRSAATVLLEARTIAVSEGMIRELQFVDFNLANIDVRNGDYEAGIERMLAIVDYMRSANMQRDYAEMLSYLADAYSLADRQKERADVLEELLHLRQRIFRSERDQMLSELQARFEAQESAQQIAFLQQQNQLQDQEIANASLQRRITFLFALSVILACMMLFFAYRAARRANKRLNRTNQDLHEQTLRDPLTGLLNRRAMRVILDQRTGSNGKPTRDSAMVLLDIDYFKQINDTLGHEAGDQVLIAIANRLRGASQHDEQIIRWGGEEFLIYIPDARHLDLAWYVQKLLSLLATRPVVYHDQDIVVSTTIGAVRLPLPGAEGTLTETQQLEDALRMTDAMLYLGKLHGRNQARVLQQFSRPYPEVREAILADLEHALNADQISLDILYGPPVKR